MKIDLYTKAILTVIAIGIGCLVFEQKPVKEAQAAGNLEQRVNIIETKLDKASRNADLCSLGPVEELRHIMQMANREGPKWNWLARRLKRCEEAYNRALGALAGK